MECGICLKNGGPEASLVCAACTRASLYPLRVDHATALLEKAQLDYRIASLYSPEGPGDIAENDVLPGGIKASDATNCARLERIQTEQAASEDRINLITEQAESLRKQMEEVKREISERKSALVQRRSDRASISHEIEVRRTNTLETVQKGIQRTSHRHDKTHGQIINARASLCQEAASLADLKQRRRKTKDGGVREDYFVCGHALLDLRDLNAKITKLDHANNFTAALIQTAGLLVLCSHYLHVRLPAEITLPHKDYPLPTIFHPQSSYTAREVPFPGTNTSHSSSNTPDGSRTLDQRPLPKPRTLFIDREMAKLAKEDPAAYSIFVEGVSLLAWDIAWLCRSQGLLTINSWEEVCPFGRNLWLLFATSSRPILGKDVEQGKATLPGLTLGHLSHGTSHSFLGAADAEMHMRTWSLRSPVKTLDRVKAHLQADLSRLEWEVLDEREWDEAAQRKDEEAVLVGASRKVGAEGHAGRESKERDEKGRNAAGWMKLRSRSDDATGANVKSVPDSDTG
ncbi:hypothetical protein EV356DRAFT_453294 [Viridothelium virens]|uniref:Autophagy-related protein 14 n=1 Tax=Viridothelium virens TaxID=1048519 RepID=A0A6A6GZK0_VIRVR|nr:hypothetical protein EV356DRAFT_453294 [Viridothelium virens]